MAEVIVALAAGAKKREEFELIEAAADPIYVRNRDEYLDALRSARVMLVWDLATPLVREVGPGGLQWIHTNSIGVNAVATPEVARSGAVISNTRGLFEQPMAEFVLASILFRVKEMQATLSRQRNRQWLQRPSGRLQGRRAVVVGAGGVGARTALLLRAVGMKVELVGRSARPSGGTVDGMPLGPVRGIDELHSLLPVADDLVLAAPLTSETRGMIGAEELRQLRHGAHLVNVGRGALIDESALLGALERGDLGAATLDVFDHEPLPATHPFWGMDNVFVSPHQSADFVGWQRAAVELFLHNLAAWEEGGELCNLVDSRAFAVDDG